MILAISACVLLTACGGGDAEEAFEAILETEDSLTVASSKVEPGDPQTTEGTFALIKRLDQFVKDYPDDVRAPECLDKIHMAYSGLQDYKSAARYAERIIKDYPDYVNRAMVLESQAGNYDMFIQPRDTSKVRYYYNLLLKEEIPAGKKKDIQKRLDNLDQTLEQYILSQ
jgi:tetratricopeptide (TPR) repeat protein